MRVLRTLILLLGMAVVATGCAQRPVAYMAYPNYPTAGIDNVVYGSGAPYAAAAGRTYAAVPAAAPYGAAAPAPSYAAAPAYGARSRGLYAYAPSGPDASAASGPATDGYALDAGDRLRVVVFGQDGLTNSYAVDAAGNIDMPLVGAVPARGASTDQLSVRIADKLRNGFIREPHVAVEIESYRPFFILGEVTQPGQYPYVANMTVETAVAIAGGFSPRAFRRTVMLDRNYYGRPTRIAVPLTFPLRPGDTVNVQERWF